MQAHENRLRQLLDSTQQYIVPLFQRLNVGVKKLLGMVLVRPDRLNRLDQRRSFSKYPLFGSVVIILAVDSATGLTLFVLINGQQRAAPCLPGLLAVLRDRARQAGAARFIKPNLPMPTSLHRFCQREMDVMSLPAETWVVRIKPRGE